MNALTHPVSPLGTLRWLIKREYWENRGGFFLAPVIAGLVSLLMTGIGLVLSLFALRRAAESGNLHVANEKISVNGLDLNLLVGNLDAAGRTDLANGIDGVAIITSSWPFVVLAFVVFFYCLGALYDDRRDRSILFWKSLPLSDTQTVLSKVLSATLLAPVIATAAALVTMLACLLLLGLVAMFYGADPMATVWGPSSPLKVVAGYLSWIPVYALWSLPTVGWLLLCSAWARNKPFLWAVLLPVFAGAVLSTTKVLSLFGGSAGWFWKHVVGRALLGTVPGIDALYRENLMQLGQQTSSIAELLGPSTRLATLATPELWFGVLAGAVMIVLAIALRRRAGEI